MAGTVNVPPTVNVWALFTTVQSEVHDEVKLLIVSESDPLLMETAEGKETSNIWPLLPVTVNESAWVVVSGQRGLVAVAVPSGRTVTVCCAVLLRQISPKSKTALASCLSERCGSMRTVMVTGTFVQSVPPKMAVPTLNCTGPETVPEIVQPADPVNETSVKVAPTGKDTVVFLADPVAEVLLLVVLKSLMETEPQPAVVMVTGSVFLLVSKVTVELSQDSNVLKLPITAVPELPPVNPVSGPALPVVTAPAADTVMVLNPSLLPNVYPIEPKLMVGACVTLPAKLTKLINNK